MLGIMPVWNSLLMSANESEFCHNIQKGKLV